MCPFVPGRMSASITWAVPGTASGSGAAKPRVHDSEGTVISGAEPDPAEEAPDNVHPINPHQNQSRLG